MISLRLASSTSAARDGDVGSVAAAHSMATTVQKVTDGVLIRFNDM
jgi:hypothetical protein